MAESTDPTALEDVHVEETEDDELDPRVIRMEGHTNHGGIYFNVPLITEVVPGLWQGGVEGVGDIPLPEEIVNLVNLAPWWSYRGHEGMHSSLQVVMYDSLEQSLGQIEAVAQWAASAWDDGPTLVHCQAGLNRSSLVVARTLMIKQGLTGSEAVALLRARRASAVLCNKAFEDYVLSFDLAESA